MGTPPRTGPMCAPARVRARACALQVTTKSHFALLDVDDDTGYLSLLLESGETKEDAQLARSEVPPPAAP